MRTKVRVVAIAAAVAGGLLIGLLLISLAHHHSQSASTQTIPPPTTTVATPTTSAPIITSTPTTTATPAISDVVRQFVTIYYSRQADISGSERYVQLLKFALPRVSSVADLSLGDSAADRAVSNGQSFSAEAVDIAFGETGSDLVEAAVTVQMTGHNGDQATTTGRFNCHLQLVAQDGRWLIASVQSG